VPKVGYARVSTSAQDTALQLDALKASGVENIFFESSSGVGPRPELRRAIASLRQGDVLVVWKLDRVARSLSDLLLILSSVKASGACIKSLTEPIDTTTPIGEFTVQILGAVAQLERSMIRERVVAGQTAARARGKKWGQRPHLTPEREEELIALFVQGGHTIASVGAVFGVKENVARRVITSRFPPSLFSRPGRPRKTRV
jgi:DNA invertase Pin-like site-specific DNA recombinase